MTLRTTNLNLLPILRALLVEGSVTRAAATLGLSQPATSHALGRLRDLFGDPLLVQVGRTMQLTTRAEQLRVRIAGVCSDIENLLLDRAFEPGRLEGEFTIATPDYMALLLGPVLIRAIASAPGVAVRLTDIGLDFRMRLASGDVDVAVIAHVPGAARGFHVARGYNDRLVGVVADDHPLATQPNIGIEDLQRYPRIGIDPRQRGRAQGDPGTEMMLANGPLMLSASHLLALPLMLAQTNAVAILPGALADQAAQMVPITQFELPGPAVPLELCMLWSPVHDADRAQQWFRGILNAAMLDHFDRSISHT